MQAFDDGRENSAQPRLLDLSYLVLVTDRQTLSPAIGAVIARIDFLAAPYQVTKTTRKAG